MVCSTHSSPSSPSVSVPNNLAVYTSRRPEETALYKVVQRHLETWLLLNRDLDTDFDPIPTHVEKNFRKFLKCGILAYGFGKARCSVCNYEYLVPFSCKTRGLCGSCSAKYMAMTGAHLVDNVLPHVPYHQWVFAFPKRVRWFLKTPKHMSAVLRICLRVVETAVRLNCPNAPAKSRFGAVTFIHFSGSSLNKHLHFHSVVTDGVFAFTENRQVEFYQADPLTDQLIEDLTETIRKRVLRYLVRHDLMDHDDAQDMLLMMTKPTHSKPLPPPRRITRITMLTVTVMGEIVQ